MRRKEYIMYDSENDSFSVCIFGDFPQGHISRGGWDSETKLHSKLDFVAPESTRNSGS